MLTSERPIEVPVGVAAGPHWAKRRMHHIFARDGRAVVVAMDGARHGPARGLERPLEAVAKVRGRDESRAVLRGEGHFITHHYPLEQIAEAFAAAADKKASGAIKVLVHP